MRARIKRVRMSRWYKMKRAFRHLEFPLLPPLLLPFWMRLACVLGLLCILFGVLMMLRIWRTTPPDFQPGVKIRGINYIQAWSLKRTARKDMAAGHYNAAALAWRMAAAHNLGDLEASRGYLEALLQDDFKELQAGMAIGQAMWLLNLAHTNQADLELAIKVCQKYRQSQFTLSLLAPLEKQLRPELEAAYLKALFDAGLLQKFAERWPSAAPRLTNDVGLRLCYASFQTCWGPPDSRDGAWKELEKMQEDPQWRTLANRLQLAASARKNDPDRYEKALQRLWEWRADTAPDHVLLWRLLAVAGNKAKAVPLALNYSAPPATASDAILLADAYIDLGLREKARQFIQSQIPSYPLSEGLWQVYAKLLTDEQQWKALVALALQIRQERRDQESLVGYSHYLEGRGLLGQDKRAQALGAFKKIPEFQFTNASIGLEIAAGLLKVGCTEDAKTFLQQTERYMTNIPTYWQLVFLVGSQRRETDLMLKSAEAALRLNPNDWASRNNYAATLITLRQKPEEAVQLTGQLLAQRPDSMGAFINHCQALLLNGRIQEADQLLQRVDPNRLNPSEANSFHLALFETYLNQREFEKAQEMGTRVDRQYLFPTEMKWFEEARQRIPLRSKSGG